MHTRFLIGFVALLTTFARAEQNQFWLAAQHDWAGKRGLYLTVGSETPAGETASLGGAKLTLGVADGSNWHILAHSAKWEFGRSHTAKAVVTATNAELWLDGVRVASQDVRFVPAHNKISFNEQPGFLREPAEYVVRQANLHVTSGKDDVMLKCGASALPVQLRLLNPAAGAGQLELEVEKAISVEAEFKFEPTPDLRKHAPFIDRFGQAIHADWPGKVRDESDLRVAMAEEEKRLAQWPAPTDRDAFGGMKSAGWTEKPTGFFRTIKRDGTWWMITPEGNPCFYIGLDNAPALAWEQSPVTGREYLFAELPDRKGPLAGAWGENAWHNAAEAGNLYFASHSANLIRKFGDAWQSRGNESAIQRSRSLGFTGFGKWTPGGGVKGVSDFAVLYHGEIPNLVRHPDIFDPQIRQRWTELLRRQIEPRKNDPHLIGWSVGNELDENIAEEDIIKILVMSD